MLYICITNFVLFVYLIFLHNYNCTIINELISFDFIAKVKFNKAGYHNIINPEITNYDNQKYPDEIRIIKDDITIINISGGTYNITLEENEELVEMKWYTYPNSTKRMFANCTNITEIDLTQFDLTSIESTIHMFLNCYNLTNVKFGNYDTSSLKNTNGMFNS